MRKEIKKLRAQFLFLALDMKPQDVAEMIRKPRETVSRVMNFERPAPETREMVADLAAKKVRAFIIDDAEESAA